MGFGGTVEDAKEMFAKADVDGSGKIERDEMLNVLRNLADKLGIDDDECKASTASIITQSNNVGDADNKISLDEFLKLLGF